MPNDNFTLNDLLDAEEPNAVPPPDEARLFQAALNKCISTAANELMAAKSLDTPLPKLTNWLTKLHTLLGMCNFPVNDFQVPPVEMGASTKPVVVPQGFTKEDILWLEKMPRGYKNVRFGEGYQLYVGNPEDSKAILKSAKEANVQAVIQEAIMKNAPSAKSPGGRYIWFWPGAAPKSSTKQLTAASA